MALARAIICEPRLVLLDEPLGALDAELRREMQLFLKEIQREIRTTFLFVTHDQEEAIAMADRICVMAQGRVVQVGTPEDIYWRPLDAYVARFFGDNNLIPGRLGPPDGHARRIDTSLGYLLASDRPELPNGDGRASDGAAGGDPARRHRRQPGRRTDRRGRLCRGDVRGHARRRRHAA